MGLGKESCCVCVVLNKSGNNRLYFMITVSWFLKGMFKRHFPKYLLCKVNVKYLTCADVQLELCDNSCACAANAACDCNVEIMHNISLNQTYFIL